MIPSVYAIPAFIALIAKVALFLYARSSRIRNLETRLYLLFLFALSIQNIVEILGFQAIARRGFFPDIDGFVYYSAGIMAIALVFDLALTLSRPSNDNQIAKTRIILYAPAVVLEILLWYTPWLVVGFESHG